jgi:hypothetical protein
LPADKRPGETYALSGASCALRNSRRRERAPHPRFLVEVAAAGIQKALSMRASSAAAVHLDVDAGRHARSSKTTHRRRRAAASAERPLLTRTLPHPKRRDREGREVAACHLSSGMHIVRILTSVFALFGPQELRSVCASHADRRWLQAVLLHGTPLVGCRHRLRGETPYVISADLRWRLCRGLALSDLPITNRLWGSDSAHCARRLRPTAPGGVLVQLQICGCLKM